MSDSSDPELDQLVASLYSAPLAEFVGRRNDLAKELRTGGNRDAAARVKALRKPSRPAWVLNQAVQTAPDTVEQLADAVTEVLTTQTKGGDLRGALDGLRTAASNMATAAAEAAAAADIRLDRSTLTQALLSVTADAASLNDLRAGRLEAIPPASALDLAANLPTSAPPPTPRAPAASAKPAPSGSVQPPATRPDAGTTGAEPAVATVDSQAIRRAEAALQEAEAAAQTTRETLAEAEAAVREATTAAEAAAAKRRQAELELQEAQLILKDAQRRAKAARNADREANDAVTRARRSLQQQQRS